MSTRKVIGGSLAAIIILVVSQVLAQLIASVCLLIQISEGICNIIAGVLYVGLAYVILKGIHKESTKIICFRFWDASIWH